MRGRETAGKGSSQPVGQARRQAPGAVVLVAGEGGAHVWRDGEHVEVAGVEELQLDALGEGQGLLVAVPGAGEDGGGRSRPKDEASLSLVSTSGAS